jgi:hypothetical protein
MDISSASRAGIWSEPAGSLPLRAISRSNLSAWYAWSISWALVHGAHLCALLCAICREGEGRRGLRCARHWALRKG